MKITGGTLRSRTLFTPKGSQTRPTSEKVRQSFFNSYQNIIIDCSFLDIFAGSGAMGFEALSRGACAAYFIENHKLAIDAIKKNIASFDLSEKARLIPMHAPEGLMKLSKENLQFDCIYIDPPYHLKSIKYDIMNILDTQPIAKKNAYIFIEENQYNISNIHQQPFQTMEFCKTRTLGDTLIHVYKKK